MFGTLGGPELILILVLALIIFGPRKLPEIGKSMGKMLFELRKASSEFKQTIENEVEAEKKTESPKKALAAVAAEPVVTIAEPVVAVAEPAVVVAAPLEPVVSRATEIK
jgi:TatA/E family protein of Tat protein translocase